MKRVTTLRAMIVSTGHVLALLAMLAYLTLAAAVLGSGRKGLQAQDLALGGATIQRQSLLAAWIFHTGALAWALVAERPLLFGFAPALSMTAWLVVGVYWVEQHVFPRIKGRWVLAVLAGVVVFAASMRPGKPVEPNASGVFAMHWVLGMAAYGMFAAATVHAWLMRQAEQGMRSGAGHGQGVPLLGLERLMFRFIGLGFALLTAALAMGAWLNLGAGQPALKLDHKTVFSLLAWLAFAALGVGRWWLGWRGQRATHVVYAGALCLLLGYVGSRFVVEVVLGR